MISFNYENNFKLEFQDRVSSWISKVIVLEGFNEKDVNFIFCDDEYLHKINVDFLKHDTFTDVISFDYSSGNCISGDVFISTERIVDNANVYKVSFNSEICRVMVHGILHFCGYKDKEAKDVIIMREKEDAYLQIFNSII